MPMESPDRCRVRLRSNVLIEERQLERMSSALGRDLIGTTSVMVVLGTWYELSDFDSDSTAASGQLGCCPRTIHGDSAWRQEDKLVILRIQPRPRLDWKRKFEFRRDDGGELGILVWSGIETAMNGL